MKTIKLITLASALLGMIWLTACKKQDDRGQLTVRMTDAPANFTAVNVEIIGVEVHLADSSGGNNGWTSLLTNAGVYNLLELQDSVSVVLANNSFFPVGKINQMRLILGDSNTVGIDSLFSFPLETPGAQQSGLKININAEIKPTGRTEILLDFDAGKSVVAKGNGGFLLKPVLKIKNVVYL